jgi:hypothetical membrane protein
VATRRLLAAGAIGPPLFIATFLIEGATRPGYRVWRNFVSQLSTGDGGWMQIVNFIVCGLFVGAGAVGLARAGMPRAISAPVAVCGAGLVIAGIFVADPGLGYPPGALLEPEPTMHDLIHEAVSLVVFILLGCLPIGAGLLLSRDSRAWAGYSVLSGITALAFFAASAYAANRPDPTLPLGTLQRISIVAGFAWLSLFFLRAWRAASDAAP